MFPLRLLPELFSLVLLLCFRVSATPVNDAASGTKLAERALQDSDGYTPVNTQCPQDRPRIRASHTLSDVEKKWLRKRRSKTVQPMKDFLGRLNIPGFDAAGYITKNGQGDFKNLPNIGIAFSGGGYRAMTVGAGVYSAFDSRTPGSTAPGHIGGLLQSATYISGLSGGAFMIGSLYSNNFTTVDNILDQSGRKQGSIWEFHRNIIEGPREGVWGIRSIQYLEHIHDQIKRKKEAGWDTSLTDYWGRGQAYQYFNDSDAGASRTWSSIAEEPVFSEGSLPLPILISNDRAPNTKIVSGNSTIMEISPFEFGSWDPNLFAFAPTKYTGSRFESGTVGDTESCVVGFDNAGFVMATSSTLFNIAIGAIMERKKEAGLLGPLMAPLRILAKKWGEKEDDIASWGPNPFYKWNEGTNLNANAKALSLVDGGEDGQNIPLYPHIQQQRAVDVVFAVDASGNTVPGSWPNGGAMVASYERTLNSALMNGTAFPAVPDPYTFINLGLNVRPTFFGCDSKNTSAPTPLVVYIPNVPYSYMSNLSTKTTEFSNAVRNSIIQNGYEIATMGNGTVEQEWPICVGCAILLRSLERTKTTVPPKCNDCFKKHCWNGTIDSTPHSYDPPLGVARNPGRDGIKAPIAKSSASGKILSYHSIWTVAGVASGISFFF